MAKPRHHTLQGICQDVCVNYQQVVEVHRRIRDVVLQENGKVITQNLGTFFCRSVKSRSGVLNGTDWTSEPYIEVGLKGERSEGQHAIEEPPVASRIIEERIVIPLTLPTSTDGLHFAEPPNSFSILESLEFVYEEAQVNADPVTVQRTGQQTGSRNADGEPVGMSNVEITLGVRFGTVFEEPATTAGGPYIAVDGVPLNLGQSFRLGATTGTYSIETLPDFDTLYLGEVLFALHVTYDRGFA